MTTHELNEQFGVEGAVGFIEGNGGLTKIILNSPSSSAEVYLLGAHVTHYQPPGGEPVLWMSEKSWFEVGKPIRGGVPVCFPWFSSPGPRPDSPHHGFARLVAWEVEATRRHDDGRVAVTLATAADDGTRQLWPFDFRARHTVTVGAELTMALEAQNGGGEPITITEALHSYFAVSDVRNVSIRGLGGAEYVDELTEGRTRQADEKITFAAETDRSYLDTEATCVLDDPGLGRRITVAKAGSASTVVWNPWAAKAARMEDFGDDEWPEMVCIETANVHGNAVTIPPGGSHVLEARISAGPR